MKPNLLKTIASARQSFGVCQTISGILIEVIGIEAAVGEICELVLRDGSKKKGEVLGLKQGAIILCPFDGVHGISPGTRVYPTGTTQQIPVSNQMLGRVFDAMGNPIDDLECPQVEALVELHRDAPSPMTRNPIEYVMETGVRAIDAMLTLGRGQRIGIFAPAGGGKSTLLTMLTKGCTADVIILALIGERGREVKEFVDDVLKDVGLHKCIVFVATAERHALERAKCAFTATATAEFFRDQGLNVLLMIDSITRFGRAQREIGLAVGEPPTRRGYPPSLFSQLPKLFERAGNAKVGSITAIYTVLMEDEDSADPLAEEVRSLLDGHIVLSRELGEQGHYPAIAIDQSLSRIASRVIDFEHKQLATKFRKFMAKQKELELLVKLGEYELGRDPEADIALQAAPAMKQFVCQELDEPSSWHDAVTGLEGAING
jgi:ATP synthase in type III secretion protein N